MPPVARTYTEALPLTRGYGPRLVRGLRPELAYAERRSKLAVQPDTRRFGRSLLGGIRGPLRAAGGLMAGAFAGRAVLGGIASTIRAASDLGETVNKVRVVFRTSARDILRWGRGSARSLGMAQNTALGAAATFGNLFVSMKLGTPLAARMSKRIVELAADLASFNNVNPEDALEALRAGLVGEVEPLRKFGVNLNDAALRQEALRLGLVKTTKDVLPPAIKAQAAYSLILQQTRTAQGDFARTSGGLANQQRILRARTEDLKAAIGRGLLPATTAVVTFMATKAVPAAGRLGRVFGDAFRSIGSGLADLSANLGISIDLTRLRATATGWARAIIGGFQFGIRTGDWSQLGGILGNILRNAIGNGVGLMTRAFSRVDWPQVGNRIGTALGAALVAGGALVDSILQAAERVDWFGVGKRVAFLAVPFAFGFAQELTSAILRQFKEHPLESATLILSIIPVGRLAGVLARVLGRLPIAGPLLRSIAAAGRAVEGPVFGVIRSIARFFGRAIEAAFPGVGRRFGDWALRWILGISSKYNQMRETGVRFVGSLIRGIFGQHGLVTRAVGATIRVLTFPFRLAGSWLVRPGQAAVRGLIRGIDAFRGAAGRAASAVVSAIGRGFGRLRDAAAGPLRAAARVINAFLGGLDAVARKLGVRIPWRIPGFQGGGIAGGGGIPTGLGPKAFRAGGTVPGRGTGDRMLAALEPGEVVIPNRQRDRRRLFRDPAVRRRLGGPGSGAAIGGDRSILAIRLMQRGGMAGGGGRIAAVQAALRRTDPLPYVWGAAGPFGYDCSGLASAAYGALTGRGGFAGQRYFTTGSIPAGTALRPGLGTFTIGTTAGSGHMALNLAGLGAEARSTRSGIIVGPGARDVRSFARQYMLPQVGGSFLTAAITAAIRAAIGRLLGSLLGRLGGGGPMGAMARAAAGQVGRGARGFVLGPGLRGGGIVVADRGAWLAPRTATTVINSTGRYEPVGAAGPVVNVYPRQLEPLDERELARVLRRVLGVYA